MCLLQQALHALLACAGKRAGGVAEQLAFDQRLGQGGAVDSDERSVRAVAGCVQCASEHFLAGAGFTLDKQVDGLARQARRLGNQALHCGVVARDGL